jgi:RNase P/RNase MRP subunit POP5
MVKKERNRYLLFKLIVKEDFIIDNTELLRAIWKSIWRYFGLKEASRVGLWLLEFNLEHKFGIIRFSHYTKEIIITSLTLIKEIEGKNIIISPMITSGTINSIKKFTENLVRNKKDLIND